MMFCRCCSSSRHLLLIPTRGCAHLRERERVREVYKQSCSCSVSKQRKVKMYCSSRMHLVMEAMLSGWSQDSTGRRPLDLNLATATNSSWCRCRSTSRCRCRCRCQPVRSYQGIQGQQGKSGTAHSSRLSSISSSEQWGDQAWRCEVPPPHLCSSSSWPYTSHPPAPPLNSSW